MPTKSTSSRPPINPWLVAITVSLATFMEVMDTSIANVALRHIAGSVGADQSQSTWVLTSYLVSNAIVLPISGWLSSVIGRKKFYMTCVAIFTLSSFLCGIAPSLGLLLLFRILQGVGGGGLAPSEQAILTDTFSAEKRGMAFAIYGVAVVVAPAIGPALGGWITDNYSWRWIFFINIPVGILSLCMTFFIVQEPKSAKKEKEKAKKLSIDYIGFALVAIGLGSLQIVLDKGQEDDWFGSPFIITFSLLAAGGIIALILWELFGAKNPIVDIPLLKKPSFLFTNLMMFALGFVLLATTQLLPQFVQEILGYDATKAGLILMPGGFTIMAMMPLVGFLVRKIQPKYLVAFGFLSTAAALFYLNTFNTTVSFGILALGRVFQAAGIAFLFVPINTLAYANLPPGKSNNASALINVMRNLGGSVGISVATTLLARRSQNHQTVLVSHLTATANLFQQKLHAAAQSLIHAGVSAPDATKRALQIWMLQVQKQAAMLSYIDIFQILIIGSLIATFFTLFLGKINLSKASAAA